MTTTNDYTKLKKFSDLYDCAREAYGETMERLERNLEQYRGSMEIDGGMENASMVRNITYELIESEISPDIPCAKVEAAGYTERSEDLAFAAERLLYMARERLPLEEDCTEIVGENIDEGKDAENDDLAYEENNGTDDEKNAYDVYEENVGAETEENGFEKIYEAIMKHISEILSLAAFIGSLICAVIYKSGLMPLIEKGLGGVKNAAQKIKEATD